jgi:anti-sigma regulatory factor (Ser/Thr protein kinase)
MRPPYLLDRRDADAHRPVTAAADLDTAVVVMAVHGSWDHRLRRDTYLGLRKCLSEQPAALIVDLRAVLDAAAVSVPTWINARHLGDAMDPPVCVAAGTALAGRLCRMGAERMLPVFATVGQARSAVTNRYLPADRLVLRLDPTQGAAAAARELVTRACDAWELPGLLHRGRLVISELVANAAGHARTPITVLVSRRAAGLHLVVGDCSRRLPRLIEDGRPPGHAPDTSRGQGLRLVDAAATAWGAMPTVDGKMIWATLRPWAG